MSLWIDNETISTSFNLDENMLVKLQHLLEANTDRHWFQYVEEDSVSRYINLNKVRKVLIEDRSETI